MSRGKERERPACVKSHGRSQQRKFQNLRGSQARAVRNETRKIGAIPWVGSCRGCVGIHLYPKSNRKSLVWFNWGCEEWDWHTQVWVLRSPWLCLKNGMEGNHLPAGFNCPAFHGQKTATHPWRAGARSCLLSCSDFSCHLQSWLDPFMTVCMSLSLPHVLCSHCLVPYTRYKGQESLRYDSLKLHWDNSTERPTPSKVVTVLRMDIAAAVQLL